MARQVVYIDDIDGSEDAEEVAFSYRGKAYVIDLGPANRERMDKSLAEFIEHARKDGVMPAPTARQQQHSSARTRATVGTTSSTANREHTQAVREWGRRNGFDVADRGRIPSDLQEAFEKAHQAQARAVKPPLPTAEQLAQVHAESQPKPPASLPNPFAAVIEQLTMSVDDAASTPPDPGKEDSGNITPGAVVEQADEIEITKSALAEWLTGQGYNIDGMKYTARLKLFKNAHPNVKVTYIAEGRAA